MTEAAPPVGRSGGEESRPVYNVPFAWESSHGHIVELLIEHAQPGLIVDIGCGYAPHAERLVQRGFDYVGTDADEVSVQHLRQRGFRAAVADANDTASLIVALDEVTPEGADVSAVLALDVLEHLVAPHNTLASVAHWMRARDVGLFGVSLPNVTHDDVVLKLMMGRFDMTPSGLLDHTHLRFFTDASVTAMTSSVGLSEVARHDVRSPKTDQEWPEVHPVLSDGALLGTHLRRVRAMSDHHGETFQFVRLFDVGDAPATEPSLLAVRLEPPRDAITVVVAASCGDDEYDRLVEQLGAQRSGSVEIVRLTAHDDLRAMIEDVETSYVSVLHGGEILDDNWAAQMLSVAGRYPAAVVRCGPLSAADVDVARHDVEWTESFALFEHFLDDATPSAALAFPTAFLRDTSAVWRTSDADIDSHALLMEASAICGVVDTNTGSIAPARGWRRGTEAVSESLQRLAGAPLLAPFGAAAEVAAILGRLRQAEAQVESLRNQNESLEGDVTWLNAELARGPVRVTRRLTSLFTRRRNR